jgi:SAM-dependent methyltransferase
MALDPGYNRHWDEKFRTRAWGRYPPEDIVVFMGRNYRDVDHGTISVLEIGCGPGANLWFLHREGYRVAGIDGSQAAIALASERLSRENAGLNAASPDLRVGDFSRLPWPEAAFDVVIDNRALYANTLAVIRSALAEVRRVLKPGGRFYSKSWGTGTTGYGQGPEIEPGTYDEIPAGPCEAMGVSHFFDEAEIRREFAAFRLEVIDVVRRTENSRGHFIEEFLCQFSKPGG